MRLVDDLNCSDRCGRSASQSVSLSELHRAKFTWRFVGVLFGLDGEKEDWYRSTNHAECVDTGCDCDIHRPHNRGREESRHFVDSSHCRSWCKSDLPFQGRWLDSTVQWSRSSPQGLEVRLLRCQSSKSQAFHAVSQSHPV